MIVKKGLLDAIFTSLLKSAMTITANLISFHLSTKIRGSLPVIILYPLMLRKCRRLDMRKFFPKFHVEQFSLNPQLDLLCTQSPDHLMFIIKTSDSGTARESLMHQFKRLNIKSVQCTLSRSLIKSTTRDGLS